MHLAHPPSILSPSVSAWVMEDLVLIDSPVLDILAWNIHGDIDWMLHDLDVVNLFCSYDPILLQEMWLLPESHLTLPIPDGYTFWSCPCPESQSVERHGGGLAVLFHSEIQIYWCQEQSSPECMVLHLKDMTIVLLYLPSPGSLNLGPMTMRHRNGD